MDAQKIAPMRNFVGRIYEKERLAVLGKEKDASILVVYGRRRIGKTELLEQTYSERNILKFEGIQGKSQETQRMHVLRQLAVYTTST